MQVFSRGKPRGLAPRRGFIRIMLVPMKAHISIPMQKAGVKKKQKCTLPRTETEQTNKTTFPWSSSRKRREHLLPSHIVHSRVVSLKPVGGTETKNLSLFFAFKTPCLFSSPSNSVEKTDRKMMMMNGKKTTPDVGIQMPELKVAAESATMSGPLVSTRTNTNAHRRKDIVLTTLRFLCLFSSVMAMSLMTTAEEKTTISLYGFHIPVYCKWSFADSFEYLVGMSAAVVAHSLLQLLLSVVKLIKKTPVIPSRNHAWLIFAGDQVFAYAMMSAGSAASGVTNLNRTGIRHSLLPDFCKPLHRFCDRIAISIAFAFFSCFLLAISAVLDVIWLSKY